MPGPGQDPSMSRFLEEFRPTIDAAARHAFFRLGMPADELEDFVSTAWIKLLDDDMRVARLCRDAESPGGYLTVVLGNLARDYRIQRWGRWRPSTAARRLGTLAVEAERLLHRDGLSFGEAAKVLRTRGRAVDDGRLAALARRLPYRPAPAGIPRDVRAEDVSVSPEIEARDERATVARLTATLRAAIRQLSDQERWLLRRHFVDGVTVASISRQTGLDQKRTYRRLASCMRRLRAACQASGISADGALTALESPAFGLGAILPESASSFVAPSPIKLSARRRTTHDRLGSIPHALSAVVESRV